MLPQGDPRRLEASASPACGSGRHWRDRLILGCQVLAGRSLDADPLLLIRDLRELARELPSTVDVRDLLLIRSLFARALARIVQLTNADQRAEMTSTLLDWIMSIETCAGWHERLSRLLEGWEAIVAQRADRVIPGLDDLHVARALKILDARHRDPTLTLETLAAEMGLSAGYLTRLLKRHTGFGFLDHLHRRRVTGAHRLLVQTTLSVKEVAAAVGYEGSTQLGRHVKRACGIPPLALRRSVTKPFANSSQQNLTTKSNN
jgi:AraC-like DNA-binding protein